MKRFLTVVIGIIILSIIIFVSRNKNGSTNGSQIQTSKAIQAEFIKTVQSSGKTKAKNVAELKFAISGKLSWIGVKEGDRVQAYQTIAQLDSREVQKNLQNALTDYSKERNAFDETSQVTYNNMKPQQALTNTVKRILENNQYDLDKAVYSVELQSLAVEYSSLVTPIAGIVTHIDTAVSGINITPAGAVFEIVDPSTLIFEANIDEIDVGILQTGQKVTINLDAYPDSTFSGAVSNIAYSSVLSGGGATVFPVEIKFDSPELLRIGLNGDVTIQAVTVPDSILVPLEAIREDDSGKYVFKKISKSFVKTYVKTGMQNDTDIIIKTGVSPEDDVVVKGFTQIPQSITNGKP
jgi:RND family efflux transporter MFP subunit